MNTNFEVDLYRLFDEVKEPVENEAFAVRLSGRIAKRQRIGRIMAILLAFCSVAVVALISPWIMDLTGYIALGAASISQGMTLLLLSPAGWPIGTGLGLFILIKTRI